MGCCCSNPEDENSEETKGREGPVPENLPETGWGGVGEGSEIERGSREGEGIGGVDQLVPPPGGLAGPEHEPISGLQNPPPTGVLDAIVDNAYKSLRIIEFWRQASSNNSTVSAIIQDIRDLGGGYLDAIEASLQTAQDGYDFSSDAIWLCDLLLNSGTNEKDLRQYIQGIQEKATAACINCRETLEKFREVRRGLNEIRNKVPKAGDTTDFSIHVGDAHNPELDVKLEDAMAKFTEGLVTLSTVVSSFADWWVKMDTELRGAERGSADLGPGKDTERVKQVRGIWVEVRADYVRYKIRVAQLQDYYTPLTQTSATA